MLLDSCFICDIPKVFQKLHSELQHLFQCLRITGEEGACIEYSRYLVQGGKNDANKVYERSPQKEQHPKGFIGSADDIIYNTKPGVKAFLVVYRMNVFFL